MSLKNPSSLPTLDDVARDAGVSSATVSRCLSAPSKVSEKTRDRVMRAIEKLGYTPNFNARALAAKRTFTIGAIIPTMENAIFARGLQAFQERLGEKGYTLLVSSSSYDPELEAKQIKSLIARGADGLLLIGYERASEVYEYLRSRKTPFLLAWSYRQQGHFSAIGFDNRRSMQELAQAVLAKGHRDIAIISGITKGNDRAAERVEGIRAALMSADLDPDTAPLIEAEYTLESGAQALECILEQGHRPTVVMCTNDVLAVGAMQAAKARGLLVPDDISITGFDDIELAKVVTPQLATVHVPHWQMGWMAADELIDMVEKGNAGKSTKLESSLCLRASLGLKE